MTFLGEVMFDILSSLLFSGVT